MNESRELDIYPKEKTRRIMARVALRKIAALVSSLRMEEHQNALLTKRILIVLGSMVALLLSVSIFGWAIFNPQPKVQLFSISIILGVGVGIAAVLWNTKGRK